MAQQERFVARHAPFVDPRGLGYDAIEVR